MKKIVVLLIAVSIFLMSGGACGELFEPLPTSTSLLDNTSSSETKAIFELLDDLTEKDYSNIEINIVITTDFAELHSNYSLTQNNVVYSIERLNLLSSDGNVSDLPSNYKTTVTGYALIENGQVVELDGNKEIALPSYDELKGKFNFDESNFKNVVVGSNALEADVVSPSRFYGAEMDMSNLKVKVEYTETALTQIIMSYSTTNATVQTVYAFAN